MLRQGTSWYALDNIEYLLPPPCLDESEIELQKMASNLIAEKLHSYIIDILEIHPIPDLYQFFYRNAIDNFHTNMKLFH